MLLNAIKFLARVWDFNNVRSLFLFFLLFFFNWIYIYNMYHQGRYGVLFQLRMVVRLHVRVNQCFRCRRTAFFDRWYSWNSILSYDYMLLSIGLICNSVSDCMCFCVCVWMGYRKWKFDLVTDQSCWLILFTQDMPLHFNNLWTGPFIIFNRFLIILDCIFVYFRSHGEDVWLFLLSNQLVFNRKYKYLRKKIVFSHLDL